MANHWANDAETRGAFLRVAVQMGVDDPLGVLAVKQLPEYKGTLAEAVQVVMGDASAVRLQGPLYESAQTLPEAVVTANASFQTPNGGVWQVTLRPLLTADLMMVAMKNLVTGVETFEAAVIKGRGWVPVQRYSQVSALASNGAGSSSGSGPATGQSGGTVGEYIKVGAGELLSLTVKGGKFQYEVAGRKFEIGDSRGIETAMAYWSEGCFSNSFTKADLGRNGVWTEKQFGQKLMCRFGKNKDSGYWDCLRIYPESEA